MEPPRRPVEKGRDVVKFQIEADEGVARCRLTGELDSFGAASLREAMAALSAFRAVVVDMSGVTFIDSAGLGVIVSGVRRRRDMQAEIVLAAARPPVERVLRVTGITGIVALAPTLEDALRLVSQPAA